MYRSITVPSVVLFTTATTMSTLTLVSSQEAARLRCQKSGCIDVEEQPTLIVDKKRSSHHVLPMIISWVLAFIILRLAAQLLRKMTPVVNKMMRRFLWWAGHYYDLVIELTVRVVSNVMSGSTNIQRQNKSNSSRRSNNNRRRMNSKSSNKSLGSLADLLALDDSSRSGYDSSSAGYSSAYSSYTSASSTEGGDEDKSSAMESQSGVGLSILDSSDDESSNFNTTSYEEFDEDQSRGGGSSIVSKFLEYIYESSPRNEKLRSSSRRAGGRLDKKLRRSLDYGANYDQNNNYAAAVNTSKAGAETLSKRRRSTIDETNYPSYLSQQVPTESYNNKRRESSRTQAQESSQNKPSNNGGGVKLRRSTATPAAAQSASNAKSDDNIGKLKSSLRQQQQQQKQQQKKVQIIPQRQDNQENKKKSSLGQHFNKHSSSKKTDDDENYSTMLSTVDLRSRVTRS